MLWCLHLFLHSLHNALLLPRSSLFLWISTSWRFMNVWPVRKHIILARHAGVNPFTFTAPHLRQQAPHSQPTPHSQPQNPYAAYGHNFPGIPRNGIQRRSGMRFPGTFSVRDRAISDTTFWWRGVVAAQRRQQAAFKVFSHAFTGPAVRGRCGGRLGDQLLAGIADGSLPSLSQGRF
jgi:hypothetical protein